MARYAKVVSLDQFKRMLYTKLSRNLYEKDVEELGDYREDNFDWQRFFSLTIDEEPFYSIRQKDLKKVKFDFHHLLFFQDELFLGFHQAGELCFAGLCAGGEWEWRVHFILYINEKNQVRGYIPEVGNLYNKRTKSAFGNYERLDNEVAQTIYNLESYADLGTNQEDMKAMSAEVIKWIKIRPLIEEVPITDADDVTS